MEGILWHRCTGRSCWCRLAPRLDRHGREWTIDSLVEQVVVDITHPWAAGGARELTLHEEIGLRRAIHGFVGRLREGHVIAACPWRIGGEALRGITGADPGAGAGEGDLPGPDGIPRLRAA